MLSVTGANEAPANQEKLMSVPCTDTAITAGSPAMRPDATPSGSRPAHRVSHGYAPPRRYGRNAGASGKRSPVFSHRVLMVEERRHVQENLANAIAGPELASTVVAQHETTQTQWAPGWFKRLIVRVRMWREQRESRQAFCHLLALDENLLQDIGTTRAEVERAAGLPLSQDAATVLQESRSTPYWAAR